MKNEENGEGESLCEVVELAVYWQWPDGRMPKPETATIDDGAVVGLVRYLLTSEAYA